MGRLNVSPEVYFGRACFLIRLARGLRQAAPSLPCSLGEDIAKAGQEDRRQVPKRIYVVSPPPRDLVSGWPTPGARSQGPCPGGHVRLRAGLGQLG